MSTGNTATNLSAIEQMAARIVSGLTGESVDVINTAIKGEGEIVGLSGNINPALLGMLLDAIMAILMDWIDQCPQQQQMIKAKRATRFAKIWVERRFVRPNWESNELATVRDVRDAVISEGLQASEAERQQIILDVEKPDFDVM